MRLYVQLGSGRGSTLIEREFSMEWRRRRVSLPPSLNERNERRIFPVKISLFLSSSLTTRDPTFYLPRKIFVVTQTSHGLILLSRWQGCFDPLRRMSPSLLFIPTPFIKFTFSTVSSIPTVSSRPIFINYPSPILDRGWKCSFLSIETIINFQRNLSTFFRSVKKRGEKIKIKRLNTFRIHFYNKRGTFSRQTTKPAEFSNVMVMVKGMKSFWKGIARNKLSPWKEIEFLHGLETNC